MLLGLALAASLAAAQKPRVTRDDLAKTERDIDNSIRNLDVNDPYDLLGFTRGVYLPGYGVVFTAEINLVVTPISPFHLPPTGVKLEGLHKKKIMRLAIVRDMMRQMLVNSAAALGEVPESEQVVFGVTLFYRGFEQREGLPGQIIMHAPRRLLLDFKAERIDKQQLEAGIQVQEL